MEHTPAYTFRHTLNSRAHQGVRVDGLVTQYFPDKGLCEGHLIPITPGDIAVRSSQNVGDLGLYPLLHVLMNGGQEQEPVDGATHCLASGAQEQRGGALQDISWERGDKLDILRKIMTRRTLTSR